MWKYSACHSATALSLVTAPTTGSKGQWAFPRASPWQAGEQQAANPCHLIKRVHNTVVCTVPHSCVFIHSRPCPTNPQPSQYYFREIMGECVRDGFARQGETSRIHKDKTEHLIKWGSPSACVGLMPSPITLHRAGGEPAMLRRQHLAAAPAQGNTLKEVRSKCSVLATRQPCKKSGLPVSMRTSSKQLEPKVHMNIRSLILIALATYEVKQSFPPPCDGKGAAVRQHVEPDEGDAAFESRQLQHAKPRHTASTATGLPPGHCVQLYHQSQHQERGTVGISFPQR